MSQNQMNEDSLMIEIQPKITEQNKINKQVIKDYEFKFNTDHNRLDLYLTINHTYMNHLIMRKQRHNITMEIRAKVGPKCIFYIEFQINKTDSKLLLGYEQEFKGNIQIHHIPQMHIEFKIQFNKKVKRTEDFIWAIFHHSLYGIWKNKNITPIEEQDKKYYFFKILDEQFTQYISPNVLLNISLRRRETSNSPQLGVINLGNTCFMNSCLQLFFYLRPLRKIILDYKKDNKIINNLRNVFIKLLDVEQKKPVDAEQLIQSYDKFNQIPRSQQDVQEFLLDFINQIENECPEVKSLWQGKCSQTTRSKQSSKPYVSTQIQNFAQLDVHMLDTKGNNFESIQDSLNYLLHEEQVDQTIENQTYGRINVSKIRTFEYIPDVLFINLKRYEWNKQKLRLSKILSHIRYGEDLQLGFIVGTPGNIDHDPQLDYKLFAVIVHKGSSPHNGHYFVFVNISDDQKHSQWVQFNDSLVTMSDADQVLKFTGKTMKETIFDKNAGKFIQKEMESDASSYLLVYIRRRVFNEFQSIETPLPRTYIQQKLQKTAQKQKQSLQQAKIFALTAFDSQIDLFQSDLQLMQVPVVKSQSVKDSLAKMATSIMGTQSQLFFKVYKNERCLKKLFKYEMGGDVFKFQRGYLACDYILMISKSIKHYYDQVGGKQSIGLLHVIYNQISEQYQMPTFSLFTHKGLFILDENVRKHGGKINTISDYQRFENEWNFLMQIQILKLTEDDTIPF